MATPDSMTSSSPRKTLTESFSSIIRATLFVGLLIGIVSSLTSQTREPEWQDSGQWRWYSRQDGDDKMFEAKTYVIGNDALSLVVYVATPNEAEEYAVLIKWLSGVDYVDPFSEMMDGSEEEQELRYRIGNDRVRVTTVETFFHLGSSSVLDEEVARSMIRSMVEADRMYVGLEQSTGELTATFELAGLANALRAARLFYRLEDPAQ